MSVLNSAAGEMAPQEYLPRRVGPLLAARWLDSGRFDALPQSEINEVSMWLKSQALTSTPSQGNTISFGAVHSYLTKLLSN